MGITTVIIIWLGFNALFILAALRWTTVRRRERLARIARASRHRARHPRGEVATLSRAAARHAMAWPPDLLVQHWRWEDERARQYRHRELRELVHRLMDEDEDAARPERVRTGTLLIHLQADMPEWAR